MEKKATFDLSKFSEPRFLSKSLSHSELASRLKIICFELSEWEAVEVQEDAAQEQINDLAVLASKAYLIDHRSSEVRNVCACLIADLLRLSVDPFPTSQKSLEVSLKFLIDAVTGISNTSDSSYPLKFHVLEILEKKSALLLVFHLKSRKAQSLVLEKLFSTFLTILEQDLMNSVREYIVEILSEILQDPRSSVSNDILALVLERLTSGYKDDKISAFTSVGRILTACEVAIEGRILDQIHHLLQQLGTKEFAHVICELATIVPSTVTCLTPKLQDFLEGEDSNDRLSFTRMFGDILSIQNSKIPSDFLLNSFLRRFVDVSPKIRAEAVRASGFILEAQPDSASEILCHILDRCADSEDSVRKEAVSTTCEALKIIPQLASVDILEIICRRLRDKVPEVRMLTVHQVAELYCVLFEMHPKEASFLASHTIQLLELQDVPDVSILAEKALDEIIIGKNKNSRDRAVRLCQVYEQLDDLMKDTFTKHVIEEKAMLQRLVKDVIEATKETKKISIEDLKNIPSFEILSRKLKLKESHNEAAIASIFCNMDLKCRNWLSTVCSISSDFRSIRASTLEITRYFSRQEIELKGLAQSMCIRLSSSLINQGIVNSLISDDSSGLNLGEKLELALQISDAYRGIADESIELLFKFLENDQLREKSLSIIAFCSQNSFAPFRSSLEPILFNFCQTESRLLASTSIRALYNAFASPQRIVEPWISLWSSDLNKNNANVSGILSALAQVALSDATTFSIDFESVNSFIFLDVFPPLVFQSKGGLSKKYHELAISSISVLVNQVVSISRTDEVATSTLPSQLLRILENIFIHVPSDKKGNDSLLTHAIDVFLDLICIRKVQDFATVRHLLALSSISASSNIALKSVLFEKLWECSKNLRLPHQFSAILSLFLHPLNQAFSDRARARLRYLVAAQRKRNELLIQSKAGHKSFRLPPRLHPEFGICFVVFLLAHHFFIEESSKSTQYVASCLRSFLNALFSGEQRHNFSMVFAILQSLHVSVDVVDSAYTHRCHTIGILCRKELAKAYQGKEWQQTVAQAVILPSFLFEPVNASKVTPSKVRDFLQSDKATSTPSKRQADHFNENIEEIVSLADDLTYI